MAEAVTKPYQKETESGSKALLDLQYQIICMLPWLFHHTNETILIFYTFYTLNVYSVVPVFH